VIALQDKLNAHARRGLNFVSCSAKVTPDTINSGEQLSFTLFLCPFAKFTN